MTVSHSPLLEVTDLRVTFMAGVAKEAVRGIDFTLEKGEILGIVGESGSGKSATLKAILRLLRAPTRVEGRIAWQGHDLLSLDQTQMARIRGKGISMIFQEPMSALNPILTVGVQIGEVLKVHRGLDHKARMKESIRLLDRVGIASAATRLAQYPYELSGGMRQRVMIAIALAAGPDLLLADEPTTALDVSIQDQILVLLRELTLELGMAMVLVTHDLGVVAETCHRIGVMYAGKIVEEGATRDVFDHPRHGYTAALLASVPEDVEPRTLLRTIPGAAGNGAGAQGCAFAPRCRYATAECTLAEPPWLDFDEAHRAACYRARDMPELIRQ
jgi:oligopeptide transport system ATP-binding protein